MAVESKRITHLEGTAAEWAANSALVPLRGELCLEIDTIKMKIGDGSTQYGSLAYFEGETTSVQALIDASIAAEGVDASTGPTEAGELVRLDSNGLIDDTMLPGVALQGGVTWLGDVDLTASPPAGTPSDGDTYRNSTAGASPDAGWTGLSAEVVEVGMLIIHQGGTWYRVEVVPPLVLDRDHVDDAAAATGGVPVGGLYHTSGAVKVRQA